LDEQHQHDDGMRIEDELDEYEHFANHQLNNQKQLI
jgi:hypothetical protein